MCTTAGRPWSTPLVLLVFEQKAWEENWARTLSYPVLMKVLKPEAQNIEILDDECWSPFKVLANNMANRRAGASRVNIAGPSVSLQGDKMRRWSALILSQYLEL